jgi:septum formation protein
MIVMNVPPLILASASPRRSELLRQMGLDFVVVHGKTPEVQPEYLTPQETALVNAYRKARVIAKKYPDALVLGADTVVSLGNEIFGKPGDRADARRMLAALAGQTHQVVTGVCLINLRQHRQKSFVVRTEVTFRSIDAAVIASYLEKIDPLDKAGAYAIQEHGDLIIEKINGSYSNVVGLPTERLAEEIARWPGAGKGEIKPSRG